MIEVGVERIDGLAEVRERLGNSSQMRRHITRTLNEAARIGAAAARANAPKQTRLLVSGIREDDARFTVVGDQIEARFGVSRVFPRSEGGRFTGGSQNYPVFVHEGTGLYGHLQRLITPRRARYMTFVGHTGLVTRRTIKGQRPQPYMREAFEEASVYINAHLDDMLSGLID